MLLAEVGGVTASCSPTNKRVGTLILERVVVVSVLPAMASNAPQIPSGEFDSIVLLIPSIISGLALKVSVANTAFKKPSAYLSTPSFFICLMAFARLILASFESAVDIVSHKINALKRSGFRSMALKAMYPPTEKPQNIALSIF